MTGGPFAPGGFDFTLSALFFHFQDWPATFLLVLSVDDSLCTGFRQLEYCCVVGNRPEGDAMMQGRFTVSRAALELTDALTKAQSTGDKAMTGV